MNNYKKLASVVVGILLIGILVRDTLNYYNENKIVNTSFNEVVTDIMKGREITGIALSEIGGKNLDMFTVDKEEIDNIFGLVSKMELRSDTLKFMDKVLI